MANRYVERSSLEFLALKFKIVARYHFNLWNGQHFKKKFNIYEEEEEKFSHEDFM